MQIDVTTVDWALLRKQKQTLLNVINKFRGDQSVNVVNDLVGILHLVDTIQDDAAEELGEETVFGVDKE